jgi:hypothetical protein
MNQASSIAKSLKKHTPRGIWKIIRKSKHLMLIQARRLIENLGFIITRATDYYGPTPSENALRRKSNRWIKPSSLKGVHYDLGKMQQKLANLCNKYLNEFEKLPPYNSIRNAGFGPGYPQVDAFVSYAMIREINPRRYLEVGSGMSTYYANCAIQRNLQNGGKGQITCVEPFPYSALQTISGITLLESEVQDVPMDRFLELGHGDILFIDSSHIVKIDGDVPFLFLEVLPALRTGVYIHIHDIPFPYNIPFPPNYWTLLDHEESPHWPMFWNEAMLLQALLCNSSAFNIEISCPLLRHFSEDCLKETLPFYRSVKEEANTFSSIWLCKKEAT